MYQWLRIVFFLVSVGMVVRVGAMDAPLVSEIASTANDFPVVDGAGGAATIVCETNNATVVRIAAGLFAEDIQRVTGVMPSTNTMASGVSGPIIIIGTLGQSPELDALINRGKVDVSGMVGGWEQYHIEVVSNPWSGVSSALVIAGSDRRGTAYGVFSLSKEMGVSPWYWWSDAGTQPMSAIYVDSTPFTSKEPSVTYRGLFLNDEDWGLQEWAEKNYESASNEARDIGPKTYAQIFELLLRLKGNYCWPAMHNCTRPFNHYPDNKVVADNYAIVMGSSHAEPMLRSNVYEWYNTYDPTTGQTFAQGGNYDYTSNSNGVYRYWEERAISNGAYENIFTLGKRGIHDSGMVEGSNKTEKAAWLNKIFADQRKIITQHVNADPTQVAQIFVPYKEVLDIYETGLVHVPDDVILGWPDDNHGYIRLLSDATEQQRSGGGGVYYHISYWGSPKDYLWVCSTPPSLIWEELSKAYEYNCHKLWVINVGDIKPGEIGFEFSMDLAWDVSRYDADAQTMFLMKWATREFGAAKAPEVVEVLNEYYRLGYERKPEHMNWKDTDSLTPNDYPMFSHVHYGDEAGKRLDEYAALVAKADALYTSLPSSQQSIFYQTILYPLRGSASMNQKFMETGKAYIATIQGRNTVAKRKAKAQAGYDDIQTETAAYNAIENGKWNHMMNSKPRGRGVFNMPSLPADPTLSAGELGVAVEGRLDAAYISSAGIVSPQGKGDVVLLSAALDYTALHAPMITTNINGKLATYTPGNNNTSKGPSLADGLATYEFTLTQSGTYTLSFEVNCPTVNDDSWHIQIDNGNITTWNNLDNGGAWNWSTFATTNLAAGTHTISTYRREDGAAMGGIRLIPAPTSTTTNKTLVEDTLMPLFELPEFNARTRNTYFIDLFNTGTGSLVWKATSADAWVQLSQTSGTLNEEQRLWASIDWANAPKGDALSSSIDIVHAGQTLTIPVTLWNPSTPLPLSVDFVEDNGVIAIEAENYSSTHAAPDASWKRISQLGQGEGSMFITPTTAAARTSVADITNSSPVLVYNTYIRTPGLINVAARFIPTLGVSGNLRYAVSFDDEVPVIIDMHRTTAYGSLWKRSVLRAHVDYTTTHVVPIAGEHQLKIWMVDPGVVVDRFEIYTGVRPYTYRGSPETKIKNWGDYTIQSNEFASVRSNQDLVFTSLTNNSSLALLGDSTLELNGGLFINNGIVDLITWKGTLPPGFVNNGSIVDELKIDSITPVGNNVEIKVPGYPHHGYQLQKKDTGDLTSGGWANVGSPIGVVTNSPIQLQSTISTQGFFRVILSP